MDEAFFKSIVDPDVREQWFEFCLANDPTFSWSFAYAQKHIEDPTEQVKFVSIVMSKKQVERLTEAHSYLFPMVGKRKCSHCKGRGELEEMSAFGKCFVQCDKCHGTGKPTRKVS